MEDKLTFIEGKSEKKGNRKGKVALFLMLLMCSMVMISVVSAFEFDNTKSYDVADRSVTITNSFMKVINLEAIAKVTPTTPHVNYVIRGKDRLVAEFDIEAYTDYTEKVWDGMKFYNLKNNDEIARDYKIKYQVITDKTVPNYVEECKETGELNKTTGKPFLDCLMVESGERIIQEKEWKDLDFNTDLMKGKIHVGIFADVLPNDNVEFIPTWFGVEMPEYAVWTDSLNVNLIIYHDFNTTTNLIDPLRNNWTMKAGSFLTNTTQALIGKAGDFVGTNSVWLKGSADINMNGTTNKTLNFWIRRNSTTAPTSFISITPNFYIQFTGANTATTSAQWTGGATSLPMPDNKWVMVTYVKDASNKGNGTIYINGTLRASGISTIANGDYNNMSLMSYHDGTEITTGQMDEFSIWNRTLSQAEITDLYNAGVGMTYIATGGTSSANGSISVSLNSYPSGTINNWSSSGLAWNGSLLNGLKLYYDFNSTKELMSGIYNLSANEGVVSFNNSNCRVGNCSQISSGKNLRLVKNPYTNLGNSSTNVSINFWTRIDTNGGLGNYLLCRCSDVGCTSQNGYIDDHPNTNANWVGSITPLPFGAYTVWQMVTYIHNDTGGGKIFVNGSMIREGASTFLDAELELKFGTGFDNTSDLFKGGFDELGVWNDKELTQTEINSLYNGGMGLPFNPIDIGLSTNNKLAFNMTAYGIMSNLTNATLQVWNSSDYRWDNYTAISGMPNISSKSLFLSSFADGNYKWNYYVCGLNYSSTLICNYSSSNGTFIVDTVPPSISVTNGSGRVVFGIYGVNKTLSYNVTDKNLGVCYIYYNSVYKSIPCTSGMINSSNHFQNGSVNNASLWANDSGGLITTYPFEWTYDVYVNNETFNTVVLESSTQNFLVNVDYDIANINSISASLVLNGTAYPSTSSGSGSNLIFSSNAIVPSVNVNINHSFYWNFTLISGGVTYYVQTIPLNQTALNFSVDNCTSGSFLLYNFSIKDEELLTVYPNFNGTLKVDFRLSSFGTTNQFLNYSKVYDSNVLLKQICANINLSGIYRTDMVAEYGGADHVVEFYYIDNGTLTNTTIPTNIDLYGLNLSSSTTFLFSFTNENSNVVDDIIVHTFRKYIGEGLFREVERSKQDTNGETHVHLVEEDVIYYFMISQYGKTIYTSGTYNAKCLSTPCAISLSASPTGTNWSILDNAGGQYAVSSNKATRVITTTFSITSPDLVNVSIYKFQGGSAVLVNTTSITSASASVPLHVPLSYDNSTFFVAIHRNNSFIKSEWVDMTESGVNYFGTFGAILGGLIVLAIMLMAVTEGAGFIIFTIVAVLIIGIMGLVDLGWMAVISIICAGAIIIWKLISRRDKKG